MMTDKFSPGPWEFRFDNGYVTNNEGDPIGDVSVSENIDYGTARANGILQSAAPELLEALEQLLKCPDEQSKQWARAAIAKARGEE